MKKWISIWMLVLLASLAGAQVTLTPSNTVQLAGAPRPGLDMGGPREFGNEQILQSIFYADGGDMPAVYNQNSWTCNVGGTGGTPTTTSWPNQATGLNATATSYSVTGNVVTVIAPNSFSPGLEVNFAGFTSATFLNGGSAFISAANSTQYSFAWTTANVSSTADTGGAYQGYIPNYFNGATFIAKNSATGATYGTGTITASTATTATHGVVFTLSPAISTACSNNDVLVVMLRSPLTQMTPYQLYGRVGASICTGATFNSSDTDPASTNTIQSLQMPTGCTLTLFADQTQRNATNPNSTLAAAAVNNININGSYAQSIKYKCNAGSGSGSLTYSVIRANGGQTFVGSTTRAPACNASPGAGWTTDTNNFTGTETGTQNGNIVYSVTCNSGPCLLQDVRVVEGTTLAGNTTPFRDDVVRTVEGLNPGVIRWMDPSQWPTDVADQTGPEGNRRWGNVSNFIPFSLYGTLGYDDMLSLCDVVGTNCYISVGMFNQPSDWTSLITWLSTNAHYINIAAAGHSVYLANGNEAFNSAAGGSLYEGDGVLYGSFVGPNVAAGKGASGYSATHMKFVANSWFAPNQSYGNFGWVVQTLNTAHATSNGLPDLVEIAPYNFSTLNNCSTIGTSCFSGPTNVPTSGEPWTGMMAEIATFDTVATPPSGSSSVIASVATVQAHYPTVQTMIYEMNSGLIQGLAASQLQIDQVAAGVGEALALGAHWGLMQQVAGVAGPLGTFSLSEGYNGFSCSGGSCPSNLVSPVWGIMRTMPCGPGQLNTCQPQPRPQAVIMQTLNAAIGSNNNLMAQTETGQTTYSYPGGQPNGGTNTIAANPSVNLEPCFTWSDTANHWTIACYNLDQTASHTYNINGSFAPPVGNSATNTPFPGPGNAITDQNENLYIGNLGTTPTVALQPSTTNTFGTICPSGICTLAPAHMFALKYTLGGTPTAATPVLAPGSGTYVGTQTVTMTTSTGGATICYAVNATPTAATPGTCDVGSTTYTGPISVSVSETVNAIATESAFLNSSVGTATYVINPPPAATPTFSPVAGTYVGTQSVTISTATGGATICYVVNGTPSAAVAGTCDVGSTTYSGPVTVSVSETINALATKAAMTNSSIGSAAYVINAPTAATPTFAPGAGTYTSPQTVTISSSTGGATLCYTTDGTTPTATSGTCTHGTTYSTPVTVSSTETLKAIASEAGYNNSAVGSASYVISFFNLVIQGTIVTQGTIQQQ